VVIFIAIIIAEGAGFGAAIVNRDRGAGMSFELKYFIISEFYSLKGRLPDRAENGPALSVANTDEIVLGVDSDISTKVRS